MRNGIKVILTLAGFVFLLYHASSHIFKEEFTKNELRYCDSLLKVKGKTRDEVLLELEQFPVTRRNLNACRYYITLNNK